MTDRDKRVEHYLITIDMAPAPAHLHGYLMTNNPADQERLAERMIAFAEKGMKDLGARLMLPIILITRLDQKTARQVRKEVCKRMPDAKATMATATKLHATVWAMTHDDPWDKTLMELH